MSSQEPNESWFASSYRTFHQKHERLKKAVHEGFRYPLPKWGQRTMGFVYFLIPVIGGWHIMQWAISKSHASIGEHGEKLEIKDLQGFGDKRVDSFGRIETIRTGVKLATSDEETQKKNKRQLDRFLKKQKILHESPTTTTAAKEEPNSNHQHT